MITEKDMMHGRECTARSEVAGWLMSEKLDGCRGYWDGSTMWSKGGQEIVLPARIKDALPPVPLDGELYAGRGNFETARRAVQYGQWTEDVCFCVFDAPGHEGSFAERYAFLCSLGLRGPVSVVDHILCDSLQAALGWMDWIQAAAGEGVILRNPESLYVPGRTKDTLKLKEEPE